MKYKHIVVVSAVITIACTVLRTLQQVFAIDIKTGFYIEGYEQIGSFTTAVIMLGIVILAAVCLSVKRNPVSMPQPKPFYGFCCVVMGVVMLIYAMSTRFSQRLPDWQILVLSILGFISVIYFVIYGASSVITIKVPAVLFAVPVMFFIFKIICLFTTVSSIAVISDNIFIIFADCASLLFIFELAKAVNGIKERTLYKKFLMGAMLAIALNVIAVVPTFISGLISGSIYFRYGNIDAMLCVAVILLAVSAVRDMFSLKNVNVIRSHLVGTDIEEISGFSVDEDAENY